MLSISKKVKALIPSQPKSAIELYHSLYEGHFNDRELLNHTVTALLPDHLHLGILELQKMIQHGSMPLRGMFAKAFYLLAKEKSQGKIKDLVRMITTEENRRISIKTLRAPAVFDANLLTILLRAYESDFHLLLPIINTYVKTNVAATEDEKDVLIRSVLSQALRNSKKSHEHMQLAKSFVGELYRHEDLRQSLFPILIHNVAQTGNVDDGNQLQSLFMSLNIDPSPTHLANLIFLYAMSSNIPLVLSTLSLLKEHPDARTAKLWRHKRLKSTPLIVGYGSAMLAFCRLDLPTRALKLLDEIEISGLIMEEKTFLPLTTFLAQKNCSTEAIEILIRMKDMGIDEDLLTLQIIYTGWLNEYYGDIGFQIMKGGFTSVSKNTEWSSLLKDLPMAPTPGLKIADFQFPLLPEKAEVSQTISRRSLPTIHATVQLPSHSQITAIHQNFISLLKPHAKVGRVHAAMLRVHTQGGSFGNTVDALAAEVLYATMPLEGEYNRSMIAMLLRRKELDKAEAIKQITSS